MSKHQNKQLRLNPPTVSVSKLLKFCYFIMVFFIFSCGNETKQKAIESLTNDKPSKDTLITAKTSKSILFFGDSITAGYGLDDSNDAYPAIIQQKIDSLGLNYTVINSGLSGETTAGGKSRVSWVMNQSIDVFVLELGANDGLRGVPLSETRSNLQAIIDIVKQKSPEATIILAGMELPPNMGKDYTSEFKSIFADIATQNSLKFIPFILKDVGGIARLNQSDGIHPTIEGHKILAKTVWEVLEPSITSN